MNSWRRRTTTEQFLDFLREELVGGRWSERMPGLHRLAGEFGVNRKVVEEVLRLLEGEGLLASQGAGRRRRITLPEGAASALAPGGSSAR